MISNLRFELSFKNISQLENKLNFCKLNRIKNLNIPCKGPIKKDFFNNTIKYISNNHQEFNVTYHYSLYHQYSQNKEKSYNDLLNFLKNSYSNRNYEILLVSGSNKKTTNKLKKLYASIIKAGIYVAESIKIAEAAKIIENTQRDLNIALVNELALIFKKMNII